MSAQGISELQQHFARFPYNIPPDAGGEAFESYKTPTKVAPTIFPQSANSAFSRAAVKRCSLTKRLKGNESNEVCLFILRLTEACFC